jgi:hypothetical protein
VVDGLGVQQVGRQGRLDDVRQDAVADGVLGDVLVMLGGYHHRVDAPYLVAVEFHGHLGLAIGPEPGQLAVLADLRQPAGEQVAEMDGSRHQLRRVAAGVAEHQALVAGATGVHAHGDVGTLLVDGHHHGAGVVVEALDVVVVADVLDHVAHQRGHGDVGLGGDLARHQHQPGGEEGLAGHAAAGVILQGGIKHRVGDLIRHLVRMALRDALGCEQVSPLGGHAGLLGTPPNSRLGETMTISKRRWSLHLSDDARILDLP